MIAFICTAPYGPSDREFMLQLYNDYKRLMFSVARRYVADSPACEDIIQDSLEKLIKKLPLLRSMEQPILAGYVSATVRNTAISHLKRQGRMQEKSISLDGEWKAEPEAPGPPLDECMILAERRSNLRAIWPLLSREERMLLEGKYILRLTDQELALQSGCKPGSIRMKLSRARRKALKLLTEREGDPI